MQCVEFSLLSLLLLPSFWAVELAFQASKVN